MKKLSNQELYDAIQQLQYSVCLKKEGLDELAVIEFLKGVAKSCGLDVEIKIKKPCSKVIR